MQTNTVITGDCLTVLREMESESVDMVITDPPYGIDYQGPGRRFAKIANDKAPFIWWIYDAARVLKPDGGVLCFSRWDVQQVFIDALTLAGLAVRSAVIWDRQLHGMGDTRTMFAPQYDTILWAIKGKYRFPNGRPKDVMRYRKVVASELLHPNEKLLDLMRALAEATTKPGDLILDPFAGSGSTLTAAAELGRDYIGIELNPDYAALAAERATQATVDRTAYAGEWTEQVCVDCMDATRKDEKSCL